MGGLIKHVASMEERWLQFALNGPSAMRFDLPDGVTWTDLFSGKSTEYPQWMIDHENNFRVLPGDTLAGILAEYERVAARTEAIVAALPDLSVSHPLPEAPWLEPGGVRSARRVLLHVITETAQHAGHADIVHETIDGRTSN